MSIENEIKKNTEAVKENTETLKVLVEVFTAFMKKASSTSPKSSEKPTRTPAKEETEKGEEPGSNYVDQDQETPKPKPEKKKEPKKKEPAVSLEDIRKLTVALVAEERKQEVKDCIEQIGGEGAKLANLDKSLYPELHKALSEMMDKEEDL